jgi:hypothetical protein
MKMTDISVEALGEIHVYNENDEAIRLSDFWDKKKAVLVFVRHFG